MIYFFVRFPFVFHFTSSLPLQLQEYETSQSVHHRLAVGGAISQQEREELQSSIREQETLLQGYQKVVHTHNPTECGRESVPAHDWVQRLHWLLVLVPALVMSGIGCDVEHTCFVWGVCMPCPV